jgi:DNA polymerase-3 subunit gamma/tau
VDIVSRLTYISQSESIEIEPKALQLIAKSATGSLRDAENLLEQLTTYYGSVIKLHQVQDTLGMTGDSRTKELAEHIVDRDIVAGMNTINDIHSDGLDLKQFNRELVAYLRGLLLTKTGSSEALDLTCEDIAEMKDLAAKSSLDQILQAVKLFNQIEFSFDNYTSLPLELALMDCVLPKKFEKEITPNKDDKSESHKQIRKAVSKTSPTSIVNPVSKLVEPITEPAEISVTTADLTPTMASSETTVPVQPEAPDTASVSPSGELERIQQNWKQIVAQAPEDIRKTTAIAILRSAGVKPVSLEDNTITLAFKYSYHMEKIEESENQRITEKIIGNFLGHSCHVHCVFQPANNHLVREAQKMGAQITSVEEK